MARSKLHRYQLADCAENVIQAGKPLYTEIKGKWNELYFKNSNPIVVELACGKGEYATGLGKVFPNKNFVGMDIKGDRISRGSSTASQMALSNVAFLRAGIRYSDEFFAQDELSEIWLIHPDPQVRNRDSNKRLTNPDFLEKYSRYLKADGMFYLKTDSSFLYDYTLDTLEQSSRFRILDHTGDLHRSPLLDEHYGIRTFYEDVFIGKGYSIKYIKAQVN